MIRKIIIIVGLCLITTALVVFKGEKWDKYYKNTLYQPPRELIKQAALSFKKPGTAIDLGCGVGNEVAFLLKNGWQIWAIDNQPKAIQMLQNRNDVVAFDKLITLTAKFNEGLKEETMPSVDFVYASYSLPFCKPQEFHNVWNNIKRKILPGGKFAGHFFGYNYQGFTDQEKSEMTFLNRQQVEHLFEGFDIEYIREFEEEGRSGTGRYVHSHIFEIIAKKK